MEIFVTCERCGRQIPLSTSSESGHGTEYLAEFFYCADRDTCEAQVRFNEADRAQQLAAWRTNFREGDIVEFGNDDPRKPDWVIGTWRVELVTPDGVKLLPLRADGTLDVDRASVRSFWIK